METDNTICVSAPMTWGLFSALPKDTIVYMKPGPQAKAAAGGQRRMEQWQIISHLEGKVGEMSVPLSWAKEFFGSANLTASPNRYDYLPEGLFREIAGLADAEYEARN